MSALHELLGELFEALERAGYHWEPRSPERLLQLRKTPEIFDPLVRCFGLGLPTSDEELSSAGLSLKVIEAVQQLRPAVSRTRRRFVAHHHWPAQSGRESDYIYFGEESLR